MRLLTSSRGQLGGAQEDAVSHPGSHSCDLRVVRCQATALGATTLVGGPGNDDLFGQAGKDNLLAKNAGTDRLNGGTGRDSGSWNKKDQAKSVEKRLR
ncbi:MAG TPA: hypothetical protein VNO56_07320 [Gaiellaceae bacterium]|nr:hypothetical protein [Gaiellaceae bacterium]